MLHALWWWLCCPAAAIESTSATAACVLGLVAYLTDCRIECHSAVSASMDMSGQLLSVGEVALKSRGVRAAGVRLLLVPESNRDEGAADGARLVPVSDILEVIEHMCIKHSGGDAVRAFPWQGHDIGGLECGLVGPGSSTPSTWVIPRSRSVSCVHACLRAADGVSVYLCGVCPLFGRA